MFSLNFQKFRLACNRYLIHFGPQLQLRGPEPYLEFAGEDFTEEKFDEFLYLEAKGKRDALRMSGYFSSPVLNLAKKLNFPKDKGGTILLFLETLFSVALIENESLTSNLQLDATHDNVS